MNRDTPRKKKRREKLAERFSEDWYVDTSTGPTVRFKRKAGLLGVWQKVFGRKHSVFAMYWHFKYDMLKNEDLRKFYFPIKHDNMPVHGMPFKYELQGSWIIDDDDLKYLYGGPLIDQHGELLVPFDSGLPKLLRIAKLLTPLIGLLAAIVLLATRILQFTAIFPL